MARLSATTSPPSSRGQVLLVFVRTAACCVGQVACPSIGSPGVACTPFLNFQTLSVPACARNHSIVELYCITIAVSSQQADTCRPGNKVLEQLSF